MRRARDLRYRRDGTPNAERCNPHASLFGATRKSWLDHTPEGDWDESMVDGIYNQSYRLPNFLVETIDTPQPIPVYFMRSVGSTAGVFFWESFITALAHRAGIDQYAYRYKLLADDPLARRVLETVAQAANWASPSPDGVYRGIAYNCYVGRGGHFKTYVPRRSSSTARAIGSRSPACSARSIPVLWSIRTRSQRRSKAASDLR